MLTHRRVVIKSDSQLVSFLFPLSNFRFVSGSIQKWAVLCHNRDFPACFSLSLPFLFLSLKRTSTDLKLLLFFSLFNNSEKKQTKEKRLLRTR